MNPSKRRKTVVSGQLGIKDFFSLAKSQGLDCQDQQPFDSEDQLLPSKAFDSEDQLSLTKSDSEDQLSPTQSDSEIQLSPTEFDSEDQLPPTGWESENHLLPFSDLDSEIQLPPSAETCRASAPACPSNDFASATSCTASSVCSSSCCAGEMINQPTDPVLLKHTEKSYGSGKNFQKRQFLPVWYKSFQWLHLCSKSYKVYCYYCLAAHKSGVRVMSTKAEPAFTTTGYCNWKKATTRFKEHESSQAHRDAVAALINSQAMSVKEMINNQINTDQQRRKKSLLTQLSALKYLLRQGISIRNDHAGGSNLTVMLEHVLDEKAWVEARKYQSPEIVNEMVQLMAHKVLRTMVADLNRQCWFSLLADETRDVSNREQLVITLRQVTEEYKINEDFFGLMQVDSVTADCIFSALKQSLLSLEIPFERCRGQGYDGARNFQGHINGVAKKFVEVNKAAISVHCLAHCVNLCLQDIARNNKSVKDALNFAMEVIQLIKYSPKREVIFDRIKEQEESNSKNGIRTLCPTRWTVRTEAMQRIIDNYNVLYETMEVSSHGSDDCSRRASGVLALMEKFQTYFGLKLSILVFGITEQLSIALQGVNTSAGDCFAAVKVTIQGLQRFRSEKMFEKFFKEVKEEAKDKCDEPVLPRQRRIPRRLDEGSDEHVFTSVEALYRKEYFEVIDTIKMDLDKRFNQKSFLLVKSIETLLIDSANNQPVNLPSEFVALYQNDIDMKKLALQLQLLPDAVKSVSLDGIAIKTVTKIQTLCDILNKQPSLKMFITEVHKLLKLYLTIPVTTASAERNFSALKRVKTYLRNTMTQPRLNHCMLLHIHRDRTDNLKLVDIANEFITVNERRMHFFGQ